LRRPIESAEQNDEWCLCRYSMQLENFEAVSDNPQAKLLAAIN
jgi:putative transposase